MRLTRKAQMSLIMMLVIAVALIFYAVSANWTRIAARKTQITMAANQGASSLATQVASYGEYLLQTQMDNALKQVDKTSAWWKWVAAAIMVIAAVVVAVVTWGGGGGASAWLVGAAISLIAGAVTTIGMAAVDSLSTQRTNTKQWGKALANISTTEGRFAEQGVQTMLQAVVSDSAEADDRLDMDMDGRWYLSELTGPSAGDKNAPKINRFAYYNSKRLLQLRSAVPFGAVKLVLKDMQEKLGLAGSDGDRKCDRDAAGHLLPLQTTPECDPCCQQPTDRSEADGCLVRDVAYLEQCAKETINPDCTPSSLNSCFIYDNLYEQRGEIPSGLFMSTLGEDDNNPHMRIVNGKLELEEGDFPRAPLYYGPDEYGGNTQETADGGVFRGADAVGKVFPMMWAFADSNTYVKDLWVNGNTVENASAACHWRAKDGTGAPVCEFKVPAVAPASIGQVYYRPSPAGVAYDQLNLGGCSGGDCYVNVFKNTLPSQPEGYDNRRIDGVRGLKLFLPPVVNDQCPTDTAGQYWKKGADRLSQTFYETWRTSQSADEYGYQPPDEVTITVSPIKYMLPTTLGAACTSAACKCGDGSTVEERWRNDNLDDAVQVMTDLTTAAITLWGIPEALYSEMLNAVNAWGDPLKTLTDRIDVMSTRLGVQINDMDKWLAGDQVDYNYVGADLWCLPVEIQASATMAPDEIDAIVSPWGSLASVIECLQYNAGNSARFNDCYENCSTDPQSCEGLPRALLPGFDPNNDATRDLVFEQKFGNPVYDEACLEDLREKYQVCDFNQVDYDADIAACTTDACKKTYDACVALNCAAHLASCDSLPSGEAIASCKDGVTAGCIVPLCMTPACTPATCNPTACNDDACIAEVKADEDSYNACTLDETNASYLTEKEGCKSWETIAYNYCTTKKTTNIDPVTGLSKDGPRDSDFMVKILQSQDLAAKQDAKFTKRAAYLSDLRDRVIGVNNVFKGAHSYLTQPMPSASPAAQAAKAVTTKSGTPTETLRDLIQWFKDQKGGSAADGLGNDVIYGWFSKPDKGSTRGYGPLHLVRVQSSSPGYRKELAFPIITNPNDKIPWIDTDTNWTNTKRTYELKDTNGYVGARVFRYDEDHGGVMKFLSGSPLWKMVFRNPNKSALGESAVKAVFDNCTNKHYLRGAAKYDDDPDSDKDEVLKQAFIFDLPPGPGFTLTELSACRDAVLPLLERGMVSESCATYYVPPCPGPADKERPWGTDCHYDLKFSSCK